MYLRYSRKLHCIIEELSSQNNLNGDAVENIKSDYIRKLALFSTMSFLCLICAFFSPNQIATTIFLLSSLVFISLNLLPRTYLNKYILPYSLGISTRADIIGASYDFIAFHGYSGWSIRYSFCDEKGIQRFGSHNGIKNNSNIKETISEGGKIIIYYFPDKPNVNVPFIKDKYRRFCLKLESPLKTKFSNDIIWF